MRIRSRESRRSWGAVLPCLFASGLAVLSFVPAIHARYGSRDAGSAGARVAVFEVTAGEAELISADALAEGPEDQVIYRIRVKNESECEAVYSLEILNDSGIPVDFEIAEPEGRLGIGEEKTVRIVLWVPEESFRQCTESRTLEGIFAEVSFTQAEPGGTS